ncbi:NADH-quinone oxidoreductase subunit L [Methylacidiphilum caldifontis]|uniref:NADH-quinone oxidoreductase subunit L n=1 Tax=Methylacidiphilum caldifontis TaxID=2795386 RepID=A0A4Y8PCH4_9BACT|nr:NADH-quinone oxidoreductase subunit L [Methylacidiphilum caldifontis]QSR87875.1 NADH-quinone oxidoreductase subunit L [Methylacidiphilum caldifontis]TFE68937.1 NADH-quinone oxidoreductase subunit L [Methylacidiphilum caldifontis]
MNEQFLAWLLLLSPLTSAFIIWAFLKPFPLLSQWLSVGACGVSFLISLGISMGSIPVPEAIPWIDIGGLTITLGMTFDSLSKVMLLVVSGVGLMIHVYSMGYMGEDPGKSRFFAELSLFMLSMLGIVVATNFIMMYIFWELVGVSSYLLIGFWFEKPSAASAATKAFLANRIGDFGFLLGIILFWTLTGSLMFDPALSAYFKGHPLVTIMGLLLFCGCIGKSAQIPLHVWLPDAMEGPTPVSALIHAATMVAAGVYMLCRIFFVLEQSTQALEIIAWTGAITALVAALTATQQDDIKRILAYSTMSQLGYMVMAVGSSATVAAMFHLCTHAFFKALLFLGAGSILHVLHHEQDIWKMGGLWKKMPLTFLTFLIGTCALAGIPGFSGFFSKDTIIEMVGEKNKLLFGLALFTAGLTAFYMTRLFVVTFLGSPKTAVAEHAKESPLVMVMPMLILSIFAVIGGYPFLGLEKSLNAGHEPVGEGSQLNVMILSILVGLIGVGIGFFAYWKKNSEIVILPIFKNKFYFDEFYELTLLKLQQLGAQLLAWFDEWIIGFGIVRGSAFIVSVGGEILRVFQTGNIRSYAFLFGAGAAAILVYFLVRS